MVAVLVNAAADVRDLKVHDMARKGPEAKGNRRTLVHRAFNLADGKLFAVSALPGRYRVFFSIGTVTGTPTLALPLDGDDGQKRYEVGQNRNPSPGRMWRARRPRTR